MPVFRALLVCLVVSSSARAVAQPVAKLFEDSCAPCHAIGGPPGAAPDLKDVTKRRDRAWLVQFILNPEQMAKADATAAALVKQYDGAVMPAIDGLTPELAGALLRYIDGGAAPTPVDTGGARVASSADVAAGREWYQGRRRLLHAGPACVSCHRLESISGLGGGVLGPDLTQASGRLGGAAGVTRWLGNPPTPVMRAVFRDRPLSGDEAFALAALLDGERAHPGATRPQRPLFIASAAVAALAAMGSMAAVWSRRIRSVRRPMLAAAARGRP